MAPERVKRVHRLFEAMSFYWTLAGHRSARSLRPVQNRRLEFAKSRRLRPRLANRPSPMEFAGYPRVP